MSTAAVIAPNGTAAVPTKTGGAVLYSPSPVAGGRRRGSKKMTKKVKAMLKKMKLMGGNPMDIEGEEGKMDVEGGRHRRRHRTRRHRRSRAGLFA
jgi:hypothetical protein